MRDCRTPAPGLTREPAPGLTREPAPGLTREPAPGLTREPAPGLTRGLLRHRRTASYQEVPGQARDGVERI